MTTSSNLSSSGPGQLLPSVAVIICTRQHPEHLRACLSAASALTYPRLQVLVVDNAPIDDRTRKVVEEFDVNYLCEPRPGLSVARNAGMKAVTADIFAFVDDDALPHSDWVQAIVAEFADPTVMAAGGRVIPVAGQEDSDEAGRLRGSYRGNLERREVGPSARDWFTQANFGALGIGTNMAFRREALEHWAGFDDRLGRGTPLYVGEETYAFACLIKAGFKVVYTPEAVVEHPYAPEPEELTTRRLLTRSAFTAYVTFLMFEEPRQAMQVFVYLVKRAFRMRIDWRESVVMPERSVVPAWRSFLALIKGPWLYFRSGGRR